MNGKDLMLSLYKTNYLLFYKKNTDYLYSPNLVLKPENKKTGAIQHLKKAIFFRIVRGWIK